MSVKDIKMLTLDELHIGMKVTALQLKHIYDTIIYLRDFEYEKGIDGSGIIYQIGEPIKASPDEIKSKKLFLICNRFDGDAFIDNDDFIREISELPAQM